MEDFQISNPRQSGKGRKFADQRFWKYEVLFMWCRPEPDQNRPAHSCQYRAAISFWKLNATADGGK